MKKYLIDLLLEGITQTSDPDAPEVIATEYNERKHISQATVEWENDISEKIKVSVMSEGVSAEVIERQMTEELLEIVVACFSDFNGINISTLRVVEVGA